MEEFVINRKSGISVGMQIAMYFREQIINGNLAPGEKLATTQELVQRLGVGTHTVREAMSRLRKEKLVESSPRRGTFVRNITGYTPCKDNETVKNGSKDQPFTFRRIAMMSSLGEGPDIFGSYRAETMSGLLKESERLNTVIQVFPQSLKRAPVEQIYKTLAASGIDGVVWPSPSKKDWIVIEYLKRQHMHVATSRRSRCDDGRACVESDYESVGYKAGSYFISQACENVLFLSYYEQDDNSPTEILDGNLPVGLHNGILRASSANGYNSKIYVTRENRQGYSPEIIDQLKTSVSAATPGTGILFSDGYQLLCLLQTYGDEIRQMLRERPFVVASNASITVRLSPLLKDLNPLLMVDPFEQVARIVLQKLLGMIDGFFENTTVLVTIKCQLFKEIIKPEDHHENRAFPANS